MDARTCKLDNRNWLLMKMYFSSSIEEQKRKTEDHHAMNSDRLDGREINYTSFVLFHPIFPCTVPTVFLRRVH